MKAGNGVRALALAALLCLAPGRAVAAGETVASRQTLIHAGRLLADPATGQVKARQTIVIEAGRIVDIRAGFEEGEHVVDLADSFVLPGLIDSHVHLTLQNGPSEAIDAVRKTSADRALDGARNARRTVEAGFTTVVDLAGDLEAVRALRGAIAAGDIPGPRIIAGTMIAVHGGHGDVHGLRPDVAAALAPAGLCSGADDCSRAVRQAIQNGADIIKIAATGGVISDTSTGLSQQMSDAELEAVVRTAHALGRRVACHAHGTGGINAALLAGVDSIEHGTFLDARSLQLMRERNTYLIPTLLAGDTVRWLASDAAWMPDAMRRKAREVAPAMIDAVRRAREAGIPIAFGTDSAISPHGENAREFALMMQAGFSAIDAIRAATIWGAAHNNLADEIGSLLPGKTADLIAVKGDPLKDITQLEKVHFVMSKGKVVRQ